MSMRSRWRCRFHPLGRRHRDRGRGCATVELALFPGPPAAIIDFVKANFSMTRVETSTYDGKIYGVPFFQDKARCSTTPRCCPRHEFATKTMADYAAYARSWCSTTRHTDGHAGAASRSGSRSGVPEVTILCGFGGLAGEKGGKWRAAYANKLSRNTLKLYFDNVVTNRTCCRRMTTLKLDFGSGNVHQDGRGWSATSPRTPPSVRDGARSRRAR